MKRLSILLPVLFVLSSTFACSRSTASESSSVNTGDASTPVPVEKTLSSFNSIQGTKYLMAGIVPKPETRETSLNPFEWINNSSRSYYGYASYATYNYVFFDTETADYHRLLPTNNYVIYQTTGFPQLVYDPDNPDQPAPTIEFWVYSVVKADFNKDGLLDHRDKLTVGVSDVGGNGYTELIENVDAVLSQYHKDNANLFIIYNVNQKNFIARINLTARQLVSTTEMDLGEDVK
jgi:hypothetical protein